MAAPPINNNTSNLHNAIKIPNSPETGVTNAQFPTAISPPPPPPPAPLTPATKLTGKRIRLKPAKNNSSSINAGKKRSTAKDKFLFTETADLESGSISYIGGNLSHHNTKITDYFSDIQAAPDPSRTRLSLGKKKATKDSNASVEISQTLIRAKEIQSTLGNEYPSFIKTMLLSHVTRCFWMGLPLRFARSFLPDVDASMVIEDENGEQYNLKFIAHKFGLSAGWKKFAIQHKLLEGDVLIFQLVESRKFKVYIVRTNDSKQIDGDVNVVNHDAHTDHRTPSLLKINNATEATMMMYSKAKGRKCSSSSSSSLLLNKVTKKHKRSNPPSQLSSDTIDHSTVTSQVQESSLGPNLSLKEVKTFKDFHIMVNNQCIDLELSEEIRKNYYDLCIARNEILHDGIREGLFYKLVAGMIGETVSIANMIKHCKLTMRKEEFDAWDSSLKSFELMGMKVGFLRDRICILSKHALESEDAKRYVEAKEEQNRNMNEIKILEAKLVQLYESNRKIEGIVDDLKEKAETCETEFQKKVDAPW